ncbi:DapH/DapD/GlmU-related protein [Kutzneria buriramensis]|uniref:Maltose O-acetyltransferase n=1 Tax=Kutzneria buriramensis TaxID=1045776 RepID=A0A3E0HD36_9PSEU|nr:DapH/DapD/GlmU-related protein [Kutzneria buriramensis]REH42572.1 maltose O-acetyltransferase [Kutzneria buriramensis]
MSRLLAQLRLEIGFVTKRALVNAFAGSTLAPRPLRWAVYRLCGSRIDTMNVFPGLQLGGPPSNLTVGRGTFLNVGCFIELVAPVRIGRDCQLGMQVMIVTSHHESTVDRVPTGRPVVIGNRVWLGARATVLPGVTIGDDVVIAAGAVVATDCVGPGTYAGVPARLIKEAA